MRTRVTAMDVQSQLKRLVSAGYRAPNNGDLEHTAAVWVKVLEGIEAHEFRQAVERYLRSDARYFPRPGHIRNVALEGRANGNAPLHTLEAQYLRWEASQEGPCPVCGATLRMVSADESDTPPVIWDPELDRIRKRTEDDPSPPDRLAVMHDPTEHAAARVPHVGPGGEAEREGER